MPGSGSLRRRPTNRRADSDEPGLLPHETGMTPKGVLSSGVPPIGALMTNIVDLI